MCTSGDACTVITPGHGLHLVQARLAASTPLQWRDAIVTAVDARDRTVTVTTLDGAGPRTLFSAAGAAEHVAVGHPVALHEQYRVLAVGGRWFNVAPTELDLP